MPRVNGIYSLPPSYKAVPGQKIRVEQHNPPLDDIAQALTNSVPRDGSAPMTGALPMGGQRITGLAKGTSPSDAARVDQVVPYSAWLNSVSALTIPAGAMLYATASNTAATVATTAWGRALLSQGGAADLRTTLELGGLATRDTINNDQWSGAALALANGGTGAITAAAARGNLGLGALATKGSVNNSDWSGAALALNNGGTGATTAAAARGNLGLGALAVKDTIDNRDWGANVLTIANGGTSANNAASARTNLGFSISNAARATFNDAESHTNAQWLAGASTSPGFPSPAQLAAVVSANIPTPAVPPRWRKFTTDERPPNTWHTNNTGAPLEFLLVNQGDAAFPVLGRRNSTTPQAMLGYSNSGTGGAPATAGGIIPPGWQYRFNTGGTVQVDEYWEKR